MMQHTNWRYQNQASREIYLGGVISDDRNCDTEIQRFIEIVENVFLKLNNQK